METEYLIVPDGTYEYIWPYIPTISDVTYRQPTDLSKPIYLKYSTIYYDLEFRKFHPFTISQNKQLQIIWESAYKKLINLSPSD